MPIFSLGPVMWLWANLAGAQSSQIQCCQRCICDAAPQLRRALQLLSKPSAAALSIQHVTHTHTPVNRREGEREVGREGGREGGMEGGMEGGREGGRERGREVLDRHREGAVLYVLTVLGQTLVLLLARGHTIYPSLQHGPSCRIKHALKKL